MERALIRHSQKEPDEADPDFDGNGRVVGQLQKLILSKALRLHVRSQTSQTLSIKALPIRMCSDIQSHTVMQMALMLSPSMLHF